MGIRQDHPVSVDYFWRRVEPGAVQGLEPLELRELVPYWYDDRFKQEVQARITVATEDSGALIGALLRLGARDPSDDHAAWLAVDGADGLEDDEMIGLLAPDEVAKVAEFLSRADPEDWMRRFRPDLAEIVGELGYRRPFDDHWAQHVVEGAQELTKLFGLAAAEGEAIIVMVVA